MPATSGHQPARGTRNPYPLSATIALGLAFVMLAAACTGSSTDTEAELPPLPVTPTTPEQDDEVDSGSGAAPATVVSCGSPAERPAGTPLFSAVCEATNFAVPVPVFRPDPGYDPNIAVRLEQRVEALVAGTTPEEQAAGYQVGFDHVEERGRIDVIADVDADGVATVDFRLDGERWNPGSLAGTSAQLFSFLDPLYATVFSDVEIAGLDLDDLCWGEMGCGAGTISRAEWQGLLFVNSGLLSHGGCDPTEAWLRPDSCTTGGLLEGELTAGQVVDVADDDTLNLRAGPGVEFFVVDEVPPGGAVDVTTAAARSSDGGSWRLVRGGGAAGWANAAFLSLTRDDTEQVADALVIFAGERSTAAFEQLPLAPEVSLGLGPEVLRIVAGDELRDPDEWVFTDDEFRGWSGPFSALDTLDRLDLYQVSTGPHPHCAADPVPAPAGFGDHERISVQPHGDVITSCLEWSTVDLFVNASGQIEAITLDLWAP